MYFEKQLSSPAERTQRSAPHRKPVCVVCGALAARVGGSGSDGIDPFAQETAATATLVFRGSAA